MHGTKSRSSARGMGCKHRDLCGIKGSKNKITGWMQKAVTESFSGSQSCLTGLVLGNAEEASCSRLRTIINNPHVQFTTGNADREATASVFCGFDLLNYKRKSTTRSLLRIKSCFHK